MELVSTFLHQTISTLNIKKPAVFNQSADYRCLILGFEHRIKVEEFS